MRCVYTPPFACLPSLSLSLILGESDDAEDRVPHFRCGNQMRLRLFRDGEGRASGAVTNL